MIDATELRTRAATLADAAAIAAIYNQGIADRLATFEAEPRTAGQMATWFKPGHLIAVGETDAAGPVAFAASFPYSARPCYAGIGDFSVYRLMELGGDGECEESRRRDRSSKLATALEVEPAELLRASSRPNR